MLFLCGTHHVNQYIVNSSAIYCTVRSACTTYARKSDQLDSSALCENTKQNHGSASIALLAEGWMVTQRVYSNTGRLVRRDKACITSSYHFKAKGQNKRRTIMTRAQINKQRQTAHRSRTRASASLLEFSNFMFNTYLIRIR